MTFRLGTYVRGFLKRNGPAKLKMRLWDEEFSGDHWDFLDDTTNDCVYPHLQRHLKQGSILDLGCGPGNTANELAGDAYQTYIGIDISEAALAKARKRTIESGRIGKNFFVCSDFLSYQPTQKFDVILFRESMYHIPSRKVKTILSRFANYLTSDGVFIARINITDGRGNDKPRLAATFRVIESGSEIVEKCQYGASGPTVIVFRPANGK
jgi:SAM-dependent methyltransferase